MKFEIVQRHQLAGGGTPVVTEAVGNHDNAVPAGTLRRLDNKIPMPGEQRSEAGNITLGFNYPVQRRNPHAGINSTLLGQQLVIHQRIQVALVVTQDQLAVALVNPKHATLS